MGRPAQFNIRPATVENIPALVRHRCEMFRDMGQLREDAYPLLAESSAAYYREAIPSGECVAWVVTPASDPGMVVAGGGVQFRRILPRPTTDGYLLKPGPQGLIVNVYTEKAWRRMGLGEMVMRAIMGWN